MSQNFVREIDSIKNINKQEYYTNKANDLLSTKEHNYIRKETEEYHCLTDNVKQTKATNVRYTDTTANPNVNYNLLTIDNSQVPKNNTNTLSASSLVEALEAKDQQIQALEDEIASLGGKKPQIVFYAGSGDEATVCDTVLTEEDGDDAYIIDCLLTLNNVSFTDEKIARIPIFDAYKNFLIEDYDTSVTINAPTTEITGVVFNDNELLIYFGTAPTSPYTGTIPIEVELTPKHPPIVRD